MVTTAIPETAESIDIEQDSDLKWLGIEFEYPVAVQPRRVPASRAGQSSGLRNDFGMNNAWLPESMPERPGNMESDHVGAEITSDPMRIHSGDPERWYVETIGKAEEMGYPFAAVGRHDSTNFGLHLNLSPLPAAKAEALYEMATETWARVFFCSSVNDAGADPWRHGGVSATDMEGRRFRSQHTVRECGDSFIDYDGSRGNYYEFRLSEPMMPNHFSAVVYFLRLLDVEGPEVARDYAMELVHEANEILTPVRQYQILHEDEQWYETAFDDRRNNDPEAAEFMAEIMGDL